MHKSRERGRARIQRYGGLLTAMVIPNMGAFLAWGMLAAFFLNAGWIPNEEFASLVRPVSIYLLPILVAFMGGRMVNGDRGAVAGTFGTIGLIIGSDVPMFLGAMIVGPLTALLLKCLDRALENKIPRGLEMVVGNFGVAIAGLAMCLLSHSLIGPVLVAVNSVLARGAEEIIRARALPLLALVNEPAKAVFLNNVIDQGIYYPLGMQQALESGKSILFMVASNPGAGVGLLLAFCLFGKGEAKQSASGALVIHFFGGIHEMYVPYLLMRPVTILGMIAGSAAGILVFSATGAGLVAGPSPGSIFAYLAMTPRGDFVGVLLGIAVAAAVSFAVNAPLVRGMREEKTDSDSDFDGSVFGMTEFDETPSDESRFDKTDFDEMLAGEVVGANQLPATISHRYENIVFVCDAGLGSSAMGAAAFRKRLAKRGITMTIPHCAIEKIPEEADAIVVLAALAPRVRLTRPDVRIIAIRDFLHDPALEEFFREVVNQSAQT